jgi:hypothetical protein
MRPLIWFVTPIAAPAWLLEALYRRARGMFWEFGVWSATVYFLVTIAATVPLVLQRSWLARGLGFYILSALEIVALISVVALPLGNIGGYRSLVAHVVRRRFVGSTRSERDLAVGKPIWIALSAYLFSVGYFSVCNQLLAELDTRAFVTPLEQGTVETLYNFLYATVVSMMTLGYAPGVYPTSNWAKALYAVQFGLGLAFIVVVFSTVVDQLAARRQRSP